MQIENDEERANDLNGKICALVYGYICRWNHLSNKEMNHKKVLMLLLYIIYIILPHAHDVMLLLQCLPKINKKTQIGIHIKTVCVCFTKTPDVAR